jgi:hypothetical protein
MPGTDTLLPPVLYACAGGVKRATFPGGLRFGPPASRVDGGLAFTILPPSMDILLTAALPIFALIFVGYSAGRWRLLAPEGIAGINLFVSAFALPVMLFDKLAATPFARLLDGPFILAWLLADLLVFGAAFLLARKGLKTSVADAAQAAMGAAYGNTGYMGLPIAQAAAGRAAAIPMALCMTLDMFLLLPLTLVLAGAGQGGGAGLRGTLAAAARALFANPMVLGVLLGATVAAMGMPLPAPLRAFTALLGAAAGPCALFAIGATLAGRTAQSTAPGGSLRQVALMAGLKLILHPLAAWGFMAGIFAVDPFWSSVAILAAALPVASTVYMVAGRNQVLLPQVSTAILASTAASVVSVSLVLALLFGVD